MYLQSGWGDGDQAGGAGSVSEVGSGWHGSACAGGGKGRAGGGGGGRGGGGGGRGGEGGEGGGGVARNNRVYLNARACTSKSC